MTFPQFIGFLRSKLACLKLNFKKYNLVVKYPQSKEAVLTTSEIDVDKNIIEPAVLISFRKLTVEELLREYEHLYFLEDKKKRSVSGFSKEASKLIENLSVIMRNIALLRAEEKHLNSLTENYLITYKAYLWLLEMPYKIKSS